MSYDDDDHTWDDGHLTADDVIESLKLKDGNVVADVGCGVGYFSLKLAPKVAEHGSVLAEDILGESLTFLWIRAFLHHQSNIRVVHGNPDDPNPTEALTLCSFRTAITSSRNL